MPWDIAGQIVDRPGLGAALLSAPVEPAELGEPAIVSEYPTCSCHNPFCPAPHPFRQRAQAEPPPALAPIDLSPVVGELARIHIALCQQYMEQRRLTEMLQQALIPWYVKLWRWMRTLGR